MRTAQQIKSEIESLQNELQTVQGTTTEVYTRIVGYYRSVTNWNKGKRQEYDERVTFSAYKPEIADINEAIQPATLKETIASSAPIFSDSIAYYSYFYRNTCPKCPPVKKYINNLPIDGKDINVDNDSGIEQAIVHNVTASPTVIFFDHSGEELFRANDIEKLEEHHQILKA